MSQNLHPPTDKELKDLSAYLAAREQGEQPNPSEPGFPTGLAGELLRLAETTQPDPAFAKALERQLQEAAKKNSSAAKPGWLAALWQSFTQPVRKTSMKRIIPVTLLAIVVLAILWLALPSIIPSPTPSQVAIVTPPTRTSGPTPLSPLTPTAAQPTARPPVAINFTPFPVPSQLPSLPSLVDALAAGYGGLGAGNLPNGLPVSLATPLPESPGQVTAFYCLENAPLTLDEAKKIADDWGLAAQLYMPAWMQSITPDQVERSYIAVDGMQKLSMWNGELSYTDLAFSPVFGGHQYPQSGLPPSDQAVNIATQFLASRGYLDYPYQVDLSQYKYGMVDFYRLLEGLSIDARAASVKIDPQGQVGTAWLSREDYQPVGTYPVMSAESAWEVLSAGGPSDKLFISYYPTTDGNPQYWGRVYLPGETAQLFGAPTTLLPAEPAGEPYVELNNLILKGDLSGLVGYLQSGQGYIHAWGQVVETNGVRSLQLAGWEPFDEFSGYFTGTILRTPQGNYLVLDDGTQLSLPVLPDNVPNGLPVYAQGGRVGDILEWFILQAHPVSEGQTPPDLSQAEVIVDHIELVYLAPGLRSMPPDVANNPSYRMLVPAWKFSGYIQGVEGQGLRYQAYVQAAFSP
jgi:hypothetical protein